MPRLADRVKDTSTTTGTGAITLAGSPPTGYRSFASAYATGDQIPYCISGGAEWEVGFGRMTSSTAFTRDTILSSSNSNNVVNFSAGTKDVFITATSEQLDNLGLGHQTVNSLRWGLL